MVGIGHERTQGAGNKDVSALNASCIGRVLRHRTAHGRDDRYQVALQCVERSNRVILKLNELQEQQHCNPAYLGPVLDDEAEELHPIDPGIPGGVPVQGGPLHVNLPVGDSPMVPEDPPCPDCWAPSPDRGLVDGPPPTVDQWKDAMVKALGKERAPFKALQVQRDTTIDYSTLGPVYQFSEVSQNEHVLDPVRLPGPILHIAHGQTYIPLSLLTTLSLNRIHNNDNIHFVKVPHEVIKQTLDPTQFSSKDNLSIHEWWQVYHNWLSLIDIIADAHVTVRWHEHHDKMWADESFSCSAKAWHTHNKQLHAHFIAKPFILDPKSTIYCQGLMRVQTDTAITAMAGSHNTHSP